ncbi:MAG: tetratricopeptide repeat protein [Acidobacteria bacterium]|nr:tetratricopeptide repeat protein [Acidobacteriota bacterium]
MTWLRTVFVETESAARWHPWIIAALCVLAYSNTLGHELVWDDGAAIKGNPLVGSFNLRGIFTTAYWYPNPKLTDLYRPITVLSFALNYAVNGFAPLFYHLTNVILHALNSLIVLLLLRRLTNSYRLALAAALIFALHPLHTEAVAWVSGRAELLGCLFILLAWWTSLERENQKLAWWRITVAATLYLLALFSKESALVFLPLASCFRAVRSQSVLSMQDHSRFHWRSIFRPCDLAFLCSATAFIFARWVVLGQVGPKTADTVPFAENPLAYSSAATRVLTSMKLLGLYLWKMLWPWNLSADYSFNQISLATWYDPAFWTSVLAFCLCVTLAIKTRFSSWIWGGILAACAGLAMVIQLFFPTGTLFAERLAYFPLLGFSIAAAAAVDHLQATRRLSTQAWSLLAVLLLAFFVRTVTRNPDWRDNNTVYAVMATNAPQSAKAQTLAGLQLVERYPKAARAYFEKSLQIYPQYLQAKLGLAQAEINAKNFARAEQILREAVQQDPYSLEAMQALAVAYRGSGRFDQALKTSDQILAQQPNDAFALTQRAMALEGLQRNAQARTAYRAAIAAGADSAEIRNRLGAIFLQERNLAAALEQFILAREFQPSDPVTYFNLADLYRQQGDKEKERQAYLDFLRYWKGDPRVAATVRARLNALP